MALRFVTAAKLVENSDYPEMQRTGWGSSFWPRFWQFFTILKIFLKKVASMLLKER